jgi:beta-lactamase class A
VPESELYRYSFFRKRDALPQEVRQEARLRYADDPRDTATPEAMARLLVEAWRDAGLSSASRTLLFEIMAGSRSGPRRLKGLVPRDTPVAHKTGTMASAVNDVGIVSLPGEAGHLAIAVFINTFHRTTWRRERTIAQASRALYDHFVARPTHSAGPRTVSCESPPPTYFTPAGL